MQQSEELQLALEAINVKARQLFGQGQVADYIPALEEVNGKQFGIAICDLEGNVYQAGDSSVNFSIQSISKLFTLIQAEQFYGEELWHGLGREPSGQRFNSLVQLEGEQGVPRNPFINAGALLICDRIETRCSAPNYQLLELLKTLSCNSHLRVDEIVARSELQHGSRNSAMAYLMKAFGNFYNPVEKVLESYTHHCAIEMNCIDLVKAALPLANKGKTLQGQQILTLKQTKRINAMLATCGLYDEAGEFAFKVGLPGKSGVGGGILAIYPGHYSICVWSPELNDAGNSLAGIYALEKLSEQFNFSIY